ncbi:hypothetical protein QR680_014779 [Steinernema hermaphroditum]|uniref:G-protein coupled receptors family 1 profile domain-containing protein n=1 Tax=Steinernema hermaphroditum TaxID=289476 RepID=A0AA39ICQ4_9BILA|nr:hypothetical protein QR680_014779 [Steinernema hermaphroditum]
MSLVDLRITEDELLVFARHISPVYMAFLPFCVILNIIIIAATIKSSRLRSNCNILIALQAVSDIFVFSSSIYPAYNAFLGRFVSVSDCFFHQMIPFAGGCFSYLLVLLIGFDRYLCVAYPILVNLSQAVEFASGPFAAVNVTIPCIIYYKLSSVYRDEIRSLFGVKPQVVPT